MVFGANAPWLLLPLAVIWRMRRDRPFTRPVPEPRLRTGPAIGGPGLAAEAGTDPASVAGGAALDEAAHRDGSA
jgi:hypothetical protein